MSETLDNQPELEKTQNVYGLPIPEGTVIHGLVYESHSHSGSQRGAIDIDVDLDTPILAPLDGVVTWAVDNNDKQGPTAEFAQFNNFIFIRHGNEYSKFSHMPQGSISSLGIREGNEVKKGQQIARCGFVGATTKPHIHWVVYKKTGQTPPTLQSLKIQPEKPLEDLVEK